jgi:hypothetical protein
VGREINPVVWTRAEFERRRSAADAFLSRVMAGPILPVVGDVDGARGLGVEPVGRRARGDA